MVLREGIFVRSAMRSLHHLGCPIVLEVPILCQANRLRTGRYELDTIQLREMSTLLRQFPGIDHRENSHHAGERWRLLDTAGQQCLQSQDNGGQVMCLLRLVESHHWVPGRQGRSVVLDFGCLRSLFVVCPVRQERETVENCMVLYCSVISKLFSLQVHCYYRRKPINLFINFIYTG